MLLALALIPVIILLIVIYKKDKKEKEPVIFMFGLFFAGMLTVISAIIAEVIGEILLGIFMPEDSVLKAYILAILLVAPAEELGKYLVLKGITWNSKHFDYSYDAIVYAVFVSLGFAAVENIGYVFSNGFGVAIMRMFTAVPGHACFAVFMGFFYSKAKYASLNNATKDYKMFSTLTILVPIVIHGVYDAIVLGANSTDEIVFAGLSLIVWVVFVIVMFVAAIIVVRLASKNDYCIVNLPETPMIFYRPSVVGAWSCSCGNVGYLNYCSKCGKMRPMTSGWTCPRCGSLSTLNFCGNCGCPRG